MGEVEVQALRGIDLDIYRGELVVLLGPSGSGKSTLLNILGGLDRPTGGTARWADYDLATASDAELTRYRRENVGFVFQFYNLIPSLTARENVALVTEMASQPMAPEEALGLVGLRDRLDHFRSQLSGGEQQRIAIARAIAKRPEVLVCDEPTGALDYATGKVVLAAIARINLKLQFERHAAEHQLELARAALLRSKRGWQSGRGELLEIRSPVDGIIFRVLQQSEIADCAGRSGPAPSLRGGVHSKAAFGSSSPLLSPRYPPSGSKSSE